MMLTLAWTPLKLSNIQSTSSYKVLYFPQKQVLRNVGKLKGIEITPYAAGHLIGGTVWKISKETEDFIYAIDYNHRKERQHSILARR